MKEGKLRKVRRLWVLRPHVGAYIPLRGFLWRYESDGNVRLDWDIATRTVWNHVGTRCISVKVSGEGPPSCAYLRHSPTSSPSWSLPIDQAHYNYRLQLNYHPLKREGRTHLKPSLSFFFFSRQVWSGLIMGSFSSSPSRRASRTWKWRGVSTWFTAGRPSNGRRASGGRTSTMKVGKGAAAAAVMSVET